MKFGAICEKFHQAFHESFKEDDEVEQGSQRAREGVWVHELELGGEQSLARAWHEQIQARKGQFKKCAFFMLERERER